MAVRSHGSEERYRWPTCLWAGADQSKETVAAWMAGLVEGPVRAHRREEECQLVLRSSTLVGLSSQWGPALRLEGSGALPWTRERQAEGRGEGRSVVPLS